MTEYPCKVIVTLYTNWGTASLPLDEWIEVGPGLRIGLTFSEVFCAEDKRKLTRSVVPLQYRNDYVSQFLIALGIFEYPWREGYNMIVEHYGRRFEIIETIAPVDLPLESQMLSKNQSFVIDSNMIATLPVGWQSIRVKSFHIDFQVFTNNRSFLKTGEDYRLEPYDRDTNFLFCAIVVRTKDVLSLDDYIPDRNCGEEIIRANEEHNLRKIQFVASRLIDKPFALISVVREVPFEKKENTIGHLGMNHQYIHLIGLSNIDGYEYAMRQMINCVLSIEEST